MGKNRYRVDLNRRLYFIKIPNEIYTLWRGQGLPSFYDALLYVLCLNLYYDKMHILSITGMYTKNNIKNYIVFFWGGAVEPLNLYPFFTRLIHRILVS